MKRLKLINILYKRPYPMSYFVRRDKPTYGLNKHKCSNCKKCTAPSDRSQSGRTAPSDRSQSGRTAPSDRSQSGRKQCNMI